MYQAEAEASTTYIKLDESLHESIENHYMWFDACPVKCTIYGRTSTK